MMSHKGKIEPRTHVNRFEISHDIIKASKIVGCQMKRQLDLPFDFHAGSCTTSNGQDEKVLMCFPEGALKKCHL